MQGNASEKTIQSAQVLDLRGVPAPDNVLSVLKRVSELPNGALLEIHADSNPCQLYDLLQQRGFFLEMQRQTDGSFLGKVRPRNIDELKH